MGCIIEKPWGTEEVLYEEPGIKVKKLRVFAGKRTSLQYHKFRSEYMTPISGHGYIQVSDAILYDKPLQIEVEETHRIIAEQDTDFVLIEVQRGTVCDDNDIVRLEDDFNRK